MPARIPEELNHLRDAERLLASKKKVSTTELLETLGKLTRLLDRRVFWEAELEPLDTDPVAMLTVPDSGKIRLAAALRDGSMVQAVLAHPEGSPSWCLLEKKSHALEDFQPDTDHVRGLCWTRHATPFRKDLDWLLVTESRDHGFRVHQLPADARAETVFRLLGEHVPPWMRICPVAVSDQDILKTPPESQKGQIPQRARGVAFHKGRQLMAVHVREEGDTEDVFEGDGLQILDENLLLIRQDPALACLDVSQPGEPKELWRLEQEDQLSAVCPVPPSGQDDSLRRCLVGFETGRLAILVETEEDTVARIWMGLVETIEAKEKLGGFAAWVAWVHEQIPTLTHRRQVGALLRVLLEKMPENLEERRRDFSEEAARLFCQPLSPEELRPVLRRFWNRMSTWTDTDQPYADVVEQIYFQLSYEIQDFIDLELQRLPEPLQTKQANEETKAYRKLIERRTVNRSRMFQEVQRKKEHVPLLTLWMEEWLESFVLEQGLPSPADSPARLRFLPGGDHALLVHPEKLYRLGFEEDSKTAFEEITPEGWFRPTRSALTVGDAENPALILVSDVKLARLTRAASGSMEISSSSSIGEEACSVSVAADAGDDHLFLAVHKQQEYKSELWLFSWDSPQEPKRAPLSARRPRELEVLGNGANGSWWIALDTAEDEVSLFRASLKRGELHIQTIAQRTVPGRVRSLALAGSNHELTLWIGTTEGYVIATRVDDAERALDLKWLYRTRGIVRHLDAHPEDQRVLALTTAGDALVFDSEGRLVWFRSLQVSLNSGRFLGSRHERLGLVDIEGRIWTYRASRSRAEAWSGVREAHDRVDDWADQKTARFELARAAQVLVNEEPDQWIDSIQKLHTEAARAGVLRQWRDTLIQPASFRRLEPGLTRMVAQCRIRELGLLARVNTSAPPREIRKTVTRALLLGLMHRAHDTQRSSALSWALAEVVRGVGRGLLTPANLQSEDWRIWWTIPQGVRGDPWVLYELLGTADDPENEADLSDMLVTATHLGPKAFFMLPRISPSHCQARAKFLSQAVEAIGSGKTVSRNAHRHGSEQCLLEKEALDLERLLCFLAETPTSWTSLCSLAQDRDSSTTTTIHPALAALLEEGRRFGELDVEATRLAPVQEQIDQITALENQLHTAQRPDGKHEDSPFWDEWIRKARELFVSRAEAILEERRRELRDRSWVRLEEVRVERLGSELVSVRIDLQRDGRPRPGAQVRIEVPEGGGLRPLDRKLALETTWDQVPSTLAWTGFLEEGKACIEILSTTSLPDEAYEESSTWKAKVPPATADVEEGFLERDGALVQDLVAPLKWLDAGLHVLALDDDLGTLPVVAELLKIPGTLRLDLDRKLQRVGPGRDDPAGLTAEKILESFGAQRTPAGGFRIPKRPDQKRLLLYAAEESAIRLLTSELRAVLEAFRRNLQSLEAPPIFWLLPSEVAGKLYAALPDATHYRPIHLGLELKESLIENLATKHPVAHQRLQSAWMQLGGHLRLLASWLEQPSNERRSPWEFLVHSDPASRLIQDDLAGVDLRQRGELAVATATRVRLSLRDLEPGMVADQKVLSTVESGRRKEIVTPGETLNKDIISNLKSDPGSHQFLWVRGLHVEGKGVDVPEALRPLWNALQRKRVGGVRRSFKQLEEREIVAIHGEIARVVPPYSAWMQERLQEEPSGRSLVEREAEGLLQSLSLAELTEAGEGLQDLLPKLSPTARRLLQRLGDAFRGSTGGLESTIRTLTGRDVRSLADEDTEARWQDVGKSIREQAPAITALFKLKARLGKTQHLIGFVEDQGALPVIELPGKLPRSKNDETILTLLGPGVPDERAEVADTLCLLPERALKEVLEAKQPSKAFWRTVRHRVGLVYLSPYQVGNQLSENSPVFVGREEETRRILQGIDSVSFLILGARKIGKTSLLRHLYGKVQKRDGHTALWFESPGWSQAAELLDGFQAASRKYNFEIPDVEDSWQAIESALRNLARDTKPVLFLNEIDGFAMHSVEILQRMRALSEEGICQFVMVGYHGAHGGLAQVDHPLFHWVHGKVGEKAFNLGALSNSAAIELIGKLEESPLELRWENAEVRSQGLEALRTKTHQIPFLLQGACQKLVEHLDSERRGVIRRDDVRWLGQEMGNPVWEHLQQTRPGKWTKEGLRDPTPAEIYWGDLVLGAVVHKKYYEPEPAPIVDPRLREQSPTVLSFNAADAQLWVQQALGRAKILSAEEQRIHRHFPQRSYGRFLDDMTLTVVLGVCCR